MLNGGLSENEKAMLISVLFHNDNANYTWIMKYMDRCLVSYQKPLKCDLLHDIGAAYKRSGVEEFISIMKNNLRTLYKEYHQKDSPL